MKLDVFRFQRDGIAPSSRMLAMQDMPPRRALFGEAGPEVWVATRYDDCKSILTDQRFLGTGAAPVDGPDLRPIMFRSASWPGGENGAQVRRRMAPLFSPRRMEAVRPFAQETVAALLADVHRAGRPADLVRHFTFPLATRMICAILDVSDAEIRLLGQWSTDVSTPPFLIAAERAEESWSRLLDYFDGDEIRIALFVAGHETTKSQLDYGIVALLQAPDQAAKLHEHTDTAVEEIMRYYPINAEGVLRTASADLEVGGVVIPRGAIVVVGGPAAVFDKRFFDDPLRFDVTRKGAAHLSFGHGPHFCIGAAIARIQMRIAFPALFAEFPRLRLAQDELRIKSGLAGGLEELLVSW